MACLGHEGYHLPTEWPGVRVAAALAMALLLAGCAGSSTPGTSGTSSATSAPPGWSRDPCDSGTGSPSGGAQPAAAFDRTLQRADTFAAHVVEAVGDQMSTETEPAAAADQHDARAWQTREGFVQVYWSTDDRAWSADYTISRASGMAAGEELDDATARNATAHAILGSLGVPADDVAWTPGASSLRGARPFGEWGLSLVRVQDTTMQAEQAQVVRRAVHVDPDYRLPSGTLLTAGQAFAAAQSFLACRGEADGRAYGAGADAAEGRVVSGSLVVWFPVQPTAGGQACPDPDGPAPHVAVDAVSGAVVSSRIPCKGAAPP